MKLVWENIINQCNCPYGFIIEHSFVYINRYFRIVYFGLYISQSVGNQTHIISIGTLPADNNPKLLISSCNTETAGVSVNLRNTGASIYSSHSQNISITQPRYSGVITY